MRGQLTIRREEEADAEFGLRLFTEIRAAEYAFLPLEPAQKAALTQMQFSLQRRQQQVDHPDAENSILLLDGRSIGRLSVARHDGTDWIIEISLLPSACGKGVGADLLRRLLATAHDAGRAVSLHVLDGNPARRLYRRLGFVDKGRFGPHWLMTASPVHAEEGS